MPHLLGGSSAALYDVPLADINVADQSFQYRLADGHADLVASLGSVGQQAPVDLLGSAPYRIVDGFRRIQAMRDLGWPAVRAFVHAQMTDDEAQTFAFVKNVVRRTLSPLERAHAIAKARERGATVDELCQRLHLSAKQVQRYIALTTFPRTVQELLAEDLITMAHAAVLSGLAPGDARIWANQVKEHDWSAQQLKRELKKAIGTRDPGRKHVYLRREENVLRVYPFRISKDAPAAQREHIVTLLKDAIEFLQTP